ncbi:MAG TPA: GNAT family N-acetyltransferase [Polyangia bacterium]|nr:GNAT family N-acetyltransferase [Polyangia bacterium]
MIEVRRLETGDVDAASAVLFHAFATVYRQRGHTPPFPNVESAVWLARAYLDIDPDGCAIAEHQGAVVGVGFAHLRGAVASIGPLAARPGARPGVGRALMAHFHALAAGASSVRLFQDSFNPDSFGLYARLGYRVVDVAPYLVASRLLPPRQVARDVRPLAAGDLEAVQRYDRARTGSTRGTDLALLAATGRGFVVERDGTLAGYLFYRPSSSRAIAGPAVAESSELLGDLLDAVAEALPGRAAVIRGSTASGESLERAFERGFRVDHLGNLMVTGAYTPPPAQLYALFPESL